MSHSKTLELEIPSQSLLAARQIPSGCETHDAIWSRVYLVTVNQRDNNARMLSDTTVALHQLRAAVPGKEAKARKEGKNAGFKSGFTWGMIGTTAVAIIVKIAQSLK